MELIDTVQEKQFVLASKSPRRQSIFNSLGLPFRIETREVNEDFSEHLKAHEIPEYLSQKKAQAFDGSLQDNELLITADTVVWINNRALNKPNDLAHAKEMLLEISGATHYVYTGVSITSNQEQRTFSEETKVHFHQLSEAEIDYYLQHHRPLDKAGAYGIQEFIGYIGIKSIEGDFYNVVGFPVQKFWQELKRLMP